MSAVVGSSLADAAAMGVHWVGALGKRLLAIASRGATWMPVKKYN
mgnify:CR=1 FL=1